MPARMPLAEWQVVRPAAPLRAFVERYVGYRLEGYPAGRHLGLPSQHLTVVLGIDQPTRLTEMPDPDQSPGSYPTLASGLTTRRAVMAHDGREHGVQLDLTPAGARSLLGVPAGGLGAAVVELPDLLGADGVEAAERLATAGGWPDRFAVLDEVLARRLDRLPPASPELGRAWDLVVRSGGRVDVATVARDVGWSRRHLSARFRAEYGLRPKEAARVVRFARSRVVLGRSSRPALADVAAACGFYDQAHLCREWAALAGCSPTAWLAGEEFPSVQDGAAPPGPG